MAYNRRNFLELDRQHIKTIQDEKTEDKGRDDKVGAYTYA
jgi:hypothetical protein